MNGSLEVRDRLLTRLVTFQKLQARMDVEVQDTLAELAALPLPSFLESPDKGVTRPPSKRCLVVT